jgi:glyoxylase-like metal-dependent hydrolase (beta-lactamase superfamily II)
MPGIMLCGGGYQESLARHARAKEREGNMIDLRLLRVGEEGCNCYLLVEPVGRQAVLVDPGDEAERILEWVGDAPMACILLTHGHSDHRRALGEVRAALGAPVGIHPADAQIFGLQADFSLRDGLRLPLGGEALEVVEIPGHTPGSVGLRLLAGGAMHEALVGDAIFPGGPGRTRSPQDLETLLSALERTVFTWPDATLLHPGHGEPTTLGAEREAFEAFLRRPRPSDLCGDVTWR